MILVIPLHNFAKTKNIMKKFSFLLTVFITLGMLNSCDKNDNIILFGVQDDIALGQQVSAEIESDPAQFPILSEEEYPDAYTHIQRITDNILNSGKVQYRDEFTWEVKLIHDDEVLNAFCTPGGYIYVYTGLIKYLDTEDQLAGVMGHEIGHADLRHSSRQLQRFYGISVLLGLILGENPNATSVRSVAKIKEHPYRAWKVNDNGSISGFVNNIEEPYNIPRQELPEIYFQTGDIR